MTNIRRHLMSPVDLAWLTRSPLKITPHAIQRAKDKFGLDVPPVELLDIWREARGLRQLLLAGREVGLEHIVYVDGTVGGVDLVLAGGEDREWPGKSVVVTVLTPDEARNNMDIFENRVAGSPPPTG
jgi:hypothetical protein